MVNNTSTLLTKNVFVLFPSNVTVTQKSQILVIGVLIIWLKLECYSIEDFGTVKDNLT